MASSFAGILMVFNFKTGEKTLAGALNGGKLVTYVTGANIFTFIFFLFKIEGSANTI